MRIDTSGAWLTRNESRFALLADGLGTAVAIVLPWSTTLTVVLIWLYLAALLPRLKVAALWQAFLEPLSIFAIALFLLAALGMLWADIAVTERLGGLSPFRLVLVIPALIVHFRHSKNAHWVLAGFLASCSVLLIVSWAIHVFPSIPWNRPIHSPDVPVKDHITQGMEFTVCIFVLAALATHAWAQQRRWLAASLIVLALAFVANIFYVAPSRTALVTLPILLVLFGLRQFGKRGLLILLIGGVALSTCAWLSSTSLRDRVSRMVEDVNEYPTNFQTPVGLRLEFWRKSIQLVAEAPLIGHGTGTVRELFRQDATREIPGTAVVTGNPHNQVLVVALQLGLVGVIVLFAMWFVHLTMFRGPGLAAWVGLVVVVQTLVASMFNSSLFDFTQGVEYGWGVGIAGAMVLREMQAADPRGNSRATQQA